MESLMQMPVHAPVDPEETMEAIGERVQDLAAGLKQGDTVYSNTTLVSVLPTLFNGGTLNLMARWPGNIRELYGLTESGISTSLDCATHPEKWDSVGMPTEGAEVRVIDERGNELPRGETGEIVGRAISMMRGYVNGEDQTRDMLWISPDGLVFYRSGDMGRVDEDGFVYILDRRKDMIISGGFNIYAVDLENVLLSHPAVADAAVIGIPSEQWGETPLGLAVVKPGSEDNKRTSSYYYTCPHG